MEQVDIDGYIEVDRRLLMARSIMNTNTGVLMDVNIGDKFVYSYLSSHAKQSNFVGRYIEDSIAHIGASIGISMRRVGNSLKKLEKVGLVVKSKMNRKCDPTAIYNVFALDNFKMYTQKSSKIRDIDGAIQGVEIVFESSQTHIGNDTIIPF